MLRAIVLLVAALCQALVLAEQRMIPVDSDRRMAVYCEGQSTNLPTVILVPAGGRTAKDWETIQPSVASFTRVCSYDHANFGASDKVPVKLLQPIEGNVDDLHAWLKASGERGPFILVGHSGSCLYARLFETRYPAETAGLVFVDSAHEEQALRLHALDPQGPPPDEIVAKMGMFTKPGQRLEWQTEVPLIVLGAGQPKPRRARDGSNSQTNRMTEEQFQEWDRIWRGFQQDLAKRSPRGEFRLAEKSGHFIQRDQPELVIQAIRDVSTQAKR